MKPYSQQINMKLYRNAIKLPFIDNLAICYNLFFPINFANLVVINWMSIIKAWVLSD